MGVRRERKRELRELFYDLTYKRKNNNHYKEIWVKISPNLPIGGAQVLFSKKKSIRGLFVGKSGCGFTHGHIYDIDIRAYDNKIWILDTESKACCPYDGIKNIDRNWQIPYKENER